MANETLKFVVTNGDIIVKFACVNYGHRIKEAIDNLLGGNAAVCDSDPRTVCRFTSYQPNVRYIFNGVPAASFSSIEHQSVFFENTEYPLNVRGNNKELESITMILSGHKRSDNEKKSNIYCDGGELYGTLNFKNQVGMVDFTFIYRIKGETETRELTFTTEVLSYKLNYRSDLKSIIVDIEHEYAMLSQSFMKDTYLQIRENSHSKTTDLIWWQIFRTCYDKILSSASLIIDRPKRRLKVEPKYERAERLRFLSRELENEYNIHKDDPNHLYRTEEMILSHNTIENRFLKYALKEMLRRFVKIKGHLLNVLKWDDQRQVAYDIEEKEKELRRINNHPFFRGVGQFKGFTQDSLVMKQALGYKDIMQQWIILQCGYDLEEGTRKLEVKDISELYEIWCYIKVKNIVKKILEERGEEVHQMKDGRVVTRDLIPQLLYGTESKMVLLRKDGIELASVSYNAQVEEINLPNVSSIEGTDTYTTVQRPDIVLRLAKEGDNILYTYLFDAKYRIADKKRPTDLDTPPVDAINQMHRYRDAIYYTQEDKESPKKEIIGGYVLFPGTVPSEKIIDGSYYYEQSNRRIGIGAFPLKPDHFIQDEKTGELIVNPGSSEQALEKQIRKWLEEEDSRQHLLERSIPQKGLEYSIAQPETIVLIGKVRNQEQYQWITNELWYNLPFANISDPSHIISAKYLLLTPPSNIGQNILFKIVPNKFDIWKKDRFTNPYGYSPSHDSYLVIRLRKLTANEELAGKNIALHNPSYAFGSAKMAYQLITFTELKKHVHE